jgi:hypothetical protein
MNLIRVSSMLSGRARMIRSHRKALRSSSKRRKNAKTRPLSLPKVSIKTRVFDLIN